MDHGLFKSAENAAQEIKKVASRIHVLVSDAGVMCIPDRTSIEQGIEAHLAINYVGHFLLIKLLIEQLISSEASLVQGRVINVSSSAHTASPFRFSDPRFIESSDLLPNQEHSREPCKVFDIPWETGYSPLMAYAQSKISMILHAKAISSGVFEEGITALSLNPGGKCNPPIP
ncbi:unnamed protein product [Fusarium langsethiae]|nr:unnamed protein product [Fusarium langsethiae]